MNQKMYKTTKKLNHSCTTFSKKTGVQFVPSLSAFQFCSDCGLIWLKNDRTQKAIRKGCTVKEDV